MTSFIEKLKKTLTPKTGEPELIHVGGGSHLEQSFKRIFPPEWFKCEHALSAAEKAKKEDGQIKKEDPLE